MPERIILPIMILCIILSACSQNTMIPSVDPAMTAVPVSITPDHIDQNVTPENSAISAENVVYSFLTAYENNRDEMVLYLDTSLQESLPAGGIQELLGFEGTLEGLVFTAGAGAPDTNLSVVEAYIQVDQKEITRIFTLQWQETTWLITKIEQAE